MAAKKPARNHASQGSTSAEPFTCEVAFLKIATYSLHDFTWNGKSWRNKLLRPSHWINSRAHKFMCAICLVNNFVHIMNLWFCWTPTHESNTKVWQREWLEVRHTEPQGHLTSAWTSTPTPLWGKLLEVDLMDKTLVDTFRASSRETRNCVEKWRSWRATVSLEDVAFPVKIWDEWH